MRNFIIYSSHVYENPLNSMLNVIFSKFIKNEICYMLYNGEKLSANKYQWKLKQTIYGILVSKIMKLLII